MKPEIIAYTWKNLGIGMLKEHISHRQISREDFDIGLALIQQDKDLSQHLKNYAKRDFDNAKNYFRE